ncbi:unnamed protein product [Durusdinium trenchii]|uniref:Uncharacterized protein n=1 Tax=Durusdinium trenchii TaxID=1381693 RepID=A0ABP0LTE6_9DINO
MDRTREVVRQDLWRGCSEAPEVRCFPQRGNGLVAPKELAAGVEVFEDPPLVALQNLFSQRLTPCCTGCLTPLGSFEEHLQQILRNAQPFEREEAQTCTLLSSTSALAADQLAWIWCRKWPAGGSLRGPAGAPCSRSSAGPMPNGGGFDWINPPRPEAFMEA